MSPHGACTPLHRQWFVGSKDSHVKQLLFSHRHTYSGLKLPLASSAESKNLPLQNSSIPELERPGEKDRKTSAEGPKT